MRVAAFFAYSAVTYGFLAATSTALARYTSTTAAQIVGLWVLALGVMVAVGVRVFMVPRRRRLCLEREGQEAVARVIDAVQTGLYVNEQPHVSLRVALQVDGKLHVVETQTVVSHLSAHKVDDGSYVRVRYVPSDPTNLQIVGTAAAHEAPALDLSKLPSKAALPERRRSPIAAPFVVYTLVMFAASIAVPAALVAHAPGRDPEVALVNSADGPRILVVRKLDRAWFEDLELELFEPSTAKRVASTKMFGDYMSGLEPTLIGANRHVWLLDKNEGLRVFDGSLRPVADHSAVTGDLGQLRWNKFDASRLTFDGERVRMQGTDGSWYELRVDASPERLEAEPAQKRRVLVGSCPASSSRPAPRRTANDAVAMPIAIHASTSRRAEKIAETKSLLAPTIVMDPRCQAQIPLRPDASTDFFIRHHVSLEGGQTSLLSRSNVDGELTWTAEFAGIPPLHRPTYVEGHLIWPVQDGILSINAKTGAAARTGGD